ncbi:MAG: redoxin domain-containing protein, partial [Gemmatimonadota bacterium]
MRSVVRRGRAPSPGPGTVALLAAVVLGAGCGFDSPPRPVAEPVTDAAPPEVGRDDDGVRRVRNHTPPERLIVYDEPSTDARLLFLGRRAARPLADGRTLWRDDERARAVLFDRARIDTVLPRSAHDSAASLRPRVRTRTVDAFALAPVRPDDPLVELLDDGGEVRRAVGAVRVPENGLLGELANAGRAALDADGGVYFAAALEPELRYYDADGRLDWRAEWTPADPPSPPRLRTRDGSLAADYTVLQTALALGPDGRAYLLAPDTAEGRDRVLVFDDRGSWIREGRVSSGHAVYVDPDGRIATLPPALALGRSHGKDRTPFEPFALPTLAGRDTVRLTDLSGRIAVLNFWASWCGPCRDEMPLLDAYARELDSTRVVVLGLNEDVDPAAGLDFARELGIGFTSVQGRGRLRRRYGYVGLPYTVILDADQRIIRTVYGFGRDI